MDIPQAKPWHALSAAERARVDQAQQVLDEHQIIIDAILEADRTGDWNAICWVEPLMPEIIAAVDAVLPIIWPGVDLASLLPGVRLGRLIGYLTAVAEDQARRLAEPVAQPPVA